MRLSLFIIAMNWEAVAGADYGILHAVSLR
jgi:hypothetical protein